MNEIVTIDQQPAMPAVTVTPMIMLQMAVQQNADLDKLKQLMELQERWEKNEARKAFHLAFSKFKAEAVNVIRNKHVTDGPLKGKSYAELFAVVDAVTPALSKHELSASWRITKDDKDWIEVTCTITHVLGHSQSVQMGALPDTGGAKNSIQARASTVTYLERYTLMAAVGLAAKGQDDDGGGGKRPGITEKQIKEFEDLLKKAMSADEVAKAWKSIAEACHAVKDSNAHADFKAKVTTRLTEFKEAA